MKLENVLIDDQCNLRLIDFGMSMTLADLFDEKVPKPVKGTFYYMAPEISKREPAQDGIKSDVFALGCILFTLYFCDYPWAEESVPPHPNEYYYKHIWNQEPDKFWEA